MTIWALSCENLFLPYANNKGADRSDQHLCCSLLSIIPVLAISEISRLQLASSWAAQFESYLVANPEDRFSGDEAHIAIIFR